MVRENWQELILSMQGKIDAVVESTRVAITALERKIDSLHQDKKPRPSGRSAKLTTTNKKKTMPTINEDEIVVDGIVPLTNQ